MLSKELRKMASKIGNKTVRYELTLEVDPDADLDSMDNRLAAILAGSKHFPEVKNIHVKSLTER